MMPERSKVFGIGFQKTGTTSLHHYLRRLGFRSVHWPHVVGGVNYEKRCIPVLNNRNNVLDVLQPVLEKFEAFSDVPFPALYRELHERMPHSRFVLVERDSDDWWGSLARHWRLLPSRIRQLDPYEYLLYNLYADVAISQISGSDEDVLKAIYRRHGESVREYFAGAEDALLAVRLDDPAIGARICAFLGVESDQPFPHLSRRSSPTGAPSMGSWR